LRTRRETVLADWLRYDILTDEIWGKGDVLIRYGIDWITARKLKFKRDTETGFFTSPRFFVAENNSAWQRGGNPVRGPDHYEASDARYTTCVAPHEDWYLRWATLEVDKARWSAPGTTRPSISSAPRSCTRRGSSSRCRTSASRASSRRRRHHGHAGLRILAALLPQPRAQLRCDDHAALMSKRGSDRRGGRYLFENAQGQAGAEYCRTIA
jgi:hypothetical protein